MNAEWIGFDIDNENVFQCPVTNRVFVAPDQASAARLLGNDGLALNQGWDLYEFDGYYGPVTKEPKGDNFPRA